MAYDPFNGRGLRYPLWINRDTGLIDGADYIRASDGGLDTSETDPGASARTANNAAILALAAQGKVILWDVDVCWHSQIWASNDAAADADPSAAQDLIVVGAVGQLWTSDTRSYKSLPRILGEDGTTSPGCAWKLTGASQLYGLRIEKPSATARDSTPATTQHGISIHNGRGYVLQDVQVFRSAASGVLVQATNYNDLTDTLESTGGFFFNVDTISTMGDGIVIGNGTNHHLSDHCRVIQPGDDYYPTLWNNDAKEVTDVHIRHCQGWGQSVAGRALGHITGRRITWSYVNIRDTVGNASIIGGEASVNGCEDVLVDHCYIGASPTSGIILDISSGTGSGTLKEVSGLTISNTVFGPGGDIGYVRGVVSDFTLDANTFQGYNDHLLLRGIENLTITDNAFAAILANNTIIDWDGSSAPDEGSGTLVISGNSFAEFGTNNTYRCILLDDYVSEMTITIGPNLYTGTNVPIEFLRANFAFGIGSGTYDQTGTIALGTASAVAQDYTAPGFTVI